jgi:amino acid permease
VPVKIEEVFKAAKEVPVKIEEVFKAATEVPVKIEEVFKAATEVPVKIEEAATEVGENRGSFQAAETLRPSQVGKLIKEGSLPEPASNRGDGTLDNEGIPNPQDGADAVGTIANIVKNVIGSGVLTVPATFMWGTPTFAVIVATAMGLLNWFSFYVVGLLSEGKHDSFAAIWRKSIGDYEVIPDVLLLVNGMITLSSFMVIIGTQVTLGLPSVFQPFGSDDRFPSQAAIICFSVGLVVIFPLCLLKNLSLLKYPSMLGIVATLYTYGFMIVDVIANGYFYSTTSSSVSYYPDFASPTLTADLLDASNKDVVGQMWQTKFQAHGPNLKVAEKKDLTQTGVEDLNTSFSLTNILIIVSIYSSTYAAHYNAPKFYCELRPDLRNPTSWMYITGIAFAIIIGMVLLFGFLGVLRFGPWINGNVLKNYSDFQDFTDKDDNIIRPNLGKVPVAISWLGIALSVMVSFPLVFFSARQAFFNILKAAFKEDEPAEGMGSGEESGKKDEKKDDEPSQMLFLGVTLGCILVTCLAGWSQIDLGDLGKLKGATTTVSLCVSIPFMALYFVARRSEDLDDGSQGLIEEGDGKAEPRSSRGVKSWFKSAGLAGVTCGVFLCMLGVSVFFLEKVAVIQTRGILFPPKLAKDLEFSLHYRKDREGKLDEFLTEIGKDAEKWKKYINRIKEAK